MRPKELFGVVVRTIGLLWIMLVLCAMIGTIYDGGLLAVTILFPFLIVGLVFLSGAEPLVDWAYRNEREPKSDRTPYTDLSGEV